MVCSNDDHANITEEQTSKLFRTISTALSCFAFFFSNDLPKDCTKEIPIRTLRSTQTCTSHPYHIWSSDYLFWIISPHPE